MNESLNGKVYKTKGEGTKNFKLHHPSFFLAIIVFFLIQLQTLLVCLGFSRLSLPNSEKKNWFLSSPLKMMMNSLVDGALKVMEYFH
ncbi:hypothetical protein VIGAN_10083500 [Vigna angularis var. angularis]|uniref:Uncharacterized protein n=1 Tax=Vigna angularis var. angularis TaxID=157739 RepID=A0A0S3T2N9_PHAAN|nr:hypothetical protein VIGAN_10083500 [Vigna angularis var. angularis]